MKRTVSASELVEGETYIIRNFGERKYIGAESGSAENLIYIFWDDVLLDKEDIDAGGFVTKEE